VDHRTYKENELSFNAIVDRADEPASVALS
jgi:hypothetical protein